MNTQYFMAAIAVLAAFSASEASAGLFRKSPLRKLENPKIVSEYRKNTEFLHEECGFYGYHREEGQTRRDALGKALAKPINKFKRTASDETKGNGLTRTLRAVGEVFAAPVKCINVRARNGILLNEAKRRGFGDALTGSRQVANENRKSNNSEGSKTSRLEPKPEPGEIRRKLPSEVDSDGNESSRSRSLY